MSRSVNIDLTKRWSDTPEVESCDIILRIIYFSQNVYHHHCGIKFGVRSQRTSSYVLAHSSLIKTLFKILRQNIQYQHRFKGKKHSLIENLCLFFLFSNFQNGRTLYIPRFVGGLVTIVRKIHMVVGLILFTNPIEFWLSWLWVNKSQKNTLFWALHWPASPFNLENTQTKEKHSLIEFECLSPNAS